MTPPRNSEKNIKWWIVVWYETIYVDAVISANYSIEN